MMIKFTIIFSFSFSLLTVLSGCGQKGELYLPTRSQTIEDQDDSNHNNDDFLVPKIQQKIEQAR